MFLFFLRSQAVLAQDFPSPGAALQTPTPQTSQHPRGKPRCRPCSCTEAPSPLLASLPDAPWPCCLPHILLSNTDFLIFDALRTG